MKRSAVATDKPITVLAIAAHPDDVEITCGGTLISLAQKGHTTGVLDLTRGESGTFGDPETRSVEAAEAARRMGLAWRGNMEFPDSAVEVTQANKLLLAQKLRVLRPELVILPHWEQRHPDHVACSRLGYDACFLAGLKKIDLIGQPHRPRKILYVSYFRNHDFSFLYDISAVIDQKLSAVAAYASQFEHKQAEGKIFHPGSNIFDLIRHRAAALGHLAGVSYAEAYVVKEPLLVDDPVSLKVQSI